MPPCAGAGIDRRESFKPLHLSSEEKDLSRELATRPKPKGYESVAQCLAFYKVVGSSARGRMERVIVATFERQDHKSNKRTKRDPSCAPGICV